MTDLLKHPVSTVSGEEPGQDGLKTPVAAKGIKMQTAEGGRVWERGHLSEGLRWGFWLSLGRLTG